MILDFLRPLILVRDDDLGILLFLGVTSSAASRRRVACEAGETGGYVRRAEGICESEYGDQIIWFTGVHECGSHCFTRYSDSVSEEGTFSRFLVSGET